MIDADPVTAPQAKPANRLDESIERYQKALGELESTNKPSFEQIVELIVARDAVEKRFQTDDNPSGVSIARLIQLDSRLRDQREVIATNPKLAKYTEQLLEWKENLNLPSTSWWWQITAPNTLNQAVEKYKQTLSELGDVGENPSIEKLLAVLQTRDDVAQLCWGEKKLPQEEIAKIIDLDDCLWEQAVDINQAINQNKELKPWKERFQSPLDSWWWQLGTAAPDLVECVNSYREALQEVQNLKYAAHLSAQDKDKKVLQLLKARDAVETAFKEQSSVSVRIAKTMFKLDEDLKDLKQKPWVRTPGKRLLVWKDILKQEESPWWWNFKLSIFSEENERMSLKDRFWILGALAFIGVGASIVVNTSQTFQTFIQDEEGVQPDILQNSLVFIQGAGLLGLGGATVTEKGRKFIENVIDDLTFIPQSWHARATFGLSVAACGMVYGINQSLPQIGNWYLAQGQNYFDEGQLFKAEVEFRQAKKLFENAEDQAKVSLQLGKIYEEQHQFEKAIAEYTSVLATNNPEVILRLGRAIMFKELDEVGWTGQISQDRILRQAENYFEQVERMIAKGGTVSKEGNSTNNQNVQQSIQDKRIQKEININQGILAWANINLDKINLEQKYLNSSDLSFLSEAKRNFETAKNLDNELPTTPESRRVRCYLELANALINKGQESQPDETIPYCMKIDERGNIADKNEGHMIQSIVAIVNNSRDSE